MSTRAEQADPTTERKKGNHVLRFRNAVDSIVKEYVTDASKSAIEAAKGELMDVAGQEAKDAWMDEAFKPTTDELKEQFKGYILFRKTREPTLRNERPDLTHRMASADKQEAKDALKELRNALVAEWNSLDPEPKMEYEQGRVPSAEPGDVALKKRAPYFIFLSKIRPVLKESLPDTSRLSVESGASELWSILSPDEKDAWKDDASIPNDPRALFAGYLRFRKTREPILRNEDPELDSLLKEHDKDGLKTLRNKLVEDWRRLDDEAADAYKSGREPSTKAAAVEPPKKVVPIFNFRAAVRPVIKNAYPEASSAMVQAVGTDLWTLMSREEQNAWQTREHRNQQQLQEQFKGYLLFRQTREPQLREAYPDLHHELAQNDKDAFRKLRDMLQREWQELDGGSRAEFNAGRVPKQAQGGDQDAMCAPRRPPAAFVFRNAVLPLLKRQLTDAPFKTQQSVAGEIWSYVLAEDEKQAWKDGTPSSIEHLDERLRGYLLFRKTREPELRAADGALDADLASGDREAMKTLGKRCATEWTVLPASAQQCYKQGEVPPAAEPKGKAQAAQKGKNAAPPARPKLSSQPVPKKQKSKDSAMVGTTSGANSSADDAITQGTEGDAESAFAMDLPEPEHWGDQTVYSTLRNYLEDMTDDGISQSEQASFDKIAAKLKSFESKEHIDVAPVYLGACADYRNMREYPVTSGSLSKQIEYQFKFMKPGDYKHHDLKDFFEPNPRGTGYVPKKVQVSGERGLQKMYDIDHVVPQRWGGLDHPRNFVLMHRSMNRSLRDAMPEDKMAYIKKRDKTILRKVSQFCHEVLSSKTVQNAVKEFILNEMKEI